ncbi:hypothetical protein Salat_2351900 [Sesamum alatum]|uniref:Uncharacterized protein n=1 Tax=Sesamum alatum TaxID=300844 RepID=A0AAE2CER3_9LAMI|nr:hypothetical protein Salat_2351900 [Sesamum alatum]
MPQVDLETLVTACAGGGTDRKIACETLADDDPQKNDVVPDDDAPEVPPDFPPESFWLSKDAEYDWFDRNAFYERKESTKGNSNSTNLNPHVNPSSNSNSQRLSANLKSKASIIGLPKTQKTLDSKRRTCKPPNIRLFPKRPESVGKSTAPVAEPGSPKVSCMGRVRSKRGRRRSNSVKRREKPALEKSSSRSEKQKTGFCAKVMSMFRSKKGQKKPARSGSRKVAEDQIMEEPPVVVEPQRKSVSTRARGIPVSAEPAAEPPGLGGMKRFASGRRSGSWASEDFSQVVSGELDRRVGGS